MSLAWPSTSAMADHRASLRRRGDALYRAILGPTLAELGERGYAGLAVERVAVRARTGEASLFARWPGRAELVAATVERAADSTAPAPDTGKRCGDLLALLAQIADRPAGLFGETVRGLMAEPLSDPQRTRDVRAALTGAGDRRLQQVAASAAARGEAELDSLDP